MRSVVILGVIALTGFALFLYLPPILIRDRELTKQEWLSAQSDMRRDVAQLLGALGLAAGLIFTYRTLSLNQQGQITDRFAKAVDQLGSTNPAVRLGGIYSMGRIAGDSPSDQGRVLDVLTAFIRNAAPVLPTSTTTEPHPPVQADVQAAVATVGHRRVANDPSGYNLNLTRVDLSRGDLSMADLTGADLTGAVVRDSILTGTKLASGALVGIDLTESSMCGADLHDAHLMYANFLRTKFGCTDVKGSEIGPKRCTYPETVDANVRAVHCESANIRGADLSQATVNHATLRRVDFSGSRLDHTYFTNTDLSGTTGLTQAQVDSANLDATDRLPSGLVSPGSQ
jgi:uncharacterized protein YjbI with pentapeptide repeats